MRTIIYQLSGGAPTGGNGTGGSTPGLGATPAGPGGGIAGSGPNGGSATYSLGCKDGGGSSFVTAVGSSNISYSMPSEVFGSGVLTIALVAPTNLTVSTTATIPAGTYNNIRD